MTDEQPPGEPNAAAVVRLRAPQPNVTRLSRKVLIGLGATAALGVFGFGYWALQSGHRAPRDELYNTGSSNVAEGLGDLPRDYSGIPHPVPALGPPLPGDLGRPILNAQGRGQIMSGIDAAQQRVSQEQDAARTSGLFINVGSNSPPAASIGLPNSISDATGSTVSPSADPTAEQNMQDQKLAFLNGPTDRQTVSPDRLVLPASPYILQAGSVIAAALITGIRSDLPGEITAQVTENVFDSPTGRYLLIPQGSKLIGQYDSEVAFSQRRVQLVWNRLILPDGSSIVLERQPGADTQGYSGLEDGVDNHWGTLFKAAVLSTLLSVGSEAGTSDQENNLAQAIRGGASTSVSQIGQQIVERNLNVQPTLTIRPGFPLRVMVERDLLLSPYQE